MRPNNRSKFNVALGIEAQGFCVINAVSFLLTLVRVISLGYASRGGGVGWGLLGVEPPLRR